MNIQAKSVQINSHRIHYRTAGPDDARAVVLLHGASFTSQTWQEIGTIKKLAETGYRVVAVDLPGFGKSESGGGPRSTWLRTFLDELNVEKPVIVSPSMSGGYSLPLVTEEPARLAGFVAVAPVAILEHRDKLSRIDCPVLAIWGENDNTIPIEHADGLVESVAQGRKVIIPGGSHAPYMSDPATFQEELLKFLGELP